MGCSSNTASFALSQPSPQRQRPGGGALLEGGLGQGAPDKERSAGGGAGGGTNHHPSQPASPPRSVHPLPPAPGGDVADPRSLWSDLLGAGPRSPDQIADKNSPASTSGGSDDRPTCAPHRVGFGASYPHFAIFIRAPALERSGRGERWPQLLPHR